MNNTITTPNPNCSTLLVADDDNIFRSILVKVLKQSGYEILEAQDGEQAVSICRNKNIDLAILDIEMPGMTGIEAAEKLGNVPVVFLTQLDNEAVISKAIRQHAFGKKALGYTVKPLDIDKIEPTIRSYLEVAKELNTKHQLINITEKALEEERRRLAIEFHDDLGQTLVAVKLDANAIKNGDYKDTNDLQRIATSLVDGIDRICGVTTNIVNRLRPTSLDSLGLEAAIEDLIAQWKVRLPECDYHFAISNSLDDINDDLRISIYRMIQECLTNIAKYAKASQVNISIIRDHETSSIHNIEFHSDVLSLSITDDGVGFDVDNYKTGLGLHGISERVFSFNGTVLVNSSPGSGTTILIKIPLNKYSK